MARRTGSRQWSDGAAGPLLGAAWQDAARCAEVDGDLWFPNPGESGHEAKKVCMGCEVRAECLQYALDHDLRFGIWGGLSELQRRAILRQREVAA